MDGLFTPVGPRRTFEGAVEQIAERIRLGDFVAGDRLPSERELAAALRISRPTLREALPRIDTVVADATPKSAPVGTDGTMAVGTSPDGSKAATLLLFTHGPALVRLEFQSALGDATTDEYVINVGKMQQIALRTGLPQ